jgi:hypothetical protein
LVLRVLLLVEVLFMELAAAVQVQAQNLFLVVAALQV